MARRRLCSYDYTLIGLIAGSLALTYFLYRASVFRLISSVRDFGLSVAYYFLAIFHAEDLITPTVTVLPSIDVLQYLPYDYEEILRRLKDMWSVFFDKLCFQMYRHKLAVFMDDFLVVFMFGILIVPIAFIAIRTVLLTPNEDKHGEKTKALQRFEGRPLAVIRATCGWLRGLWETFKSRKVYFYPLTFIWLLNLNVLTIAAGVLAYYFYFAMAFDLKNLITVQICKLLLDVVIMLSGAPLVFWICVAYAIICFVRREIGFKRLKHVMCSIRAFLKSQPIMLMVTGTMGTGKTTELTGFGILEEITFREKALDLMLECDAMFPNFPWINLEDELIRAIAYRQVKNLTTCRDWMEKKELRFLRSPVEEKIFGYDPLKYSYLIDNNLEIKKIWEVLSDYACLFFIYIVQSSLIVSNYSIRSDELMKDCGNLPLWDHELFRITAADARARTRFSHILDYDVLRLGKLVLEDNVNKGSFEFGVVMMSEIAKERGNQLTLKGVDKKSEETNQRNDGFVNDLKMARHKATVMNYPFIRIFSDEQRDMSLEADQRELLSVVHLRKKDPAELLMPFFFIEELLYDLIVPRFKNFYTLYRHARGDMSLTMYLLHNAVTAFDRYVARTYNLFGCSPVHAEVERGTKDGALEPVILPILHKLHYSGRFATDCYHGFFDPELREAKISFDEYRTYSGKVATIEELEYQNSYFIRDMQNINKTDERKEK